MEFFASEGASYIAKQSGLPAYMTETAADEFVKATGHESSRLVFTGDTFGEETAHEKYSEVREFYNNTIKLYLLGEITVDEFIDQFTTQRAEILAK